ncbi:MAG: Rid family detoxifying hydrolase [Christensenellales bacterium]|nr:Rid family detoxifying hydrolase [Christensenellales bacterium]
MQEKRQIITNQAPAPAGPYSQGIDAGRYVFVAGQRPLNAETGEMAQGIQNQTRQVLKNIESVLREAGCGLQDIVRTTVYLSDIGHFAEMNEVYSEMMPEPYPARTTFGCQLRGILVEIDAIALKPETEE